MDGVDPTAIGSPATRRIGYPRNALKLTLPRCRPGANTTCRGRQRAGQPPDRSGRPIATRSALACLRTVIGRGVMAISYYDYLPLSRDGALPIFTPTCEIWPCRRHSAARHFPGPFRTCCRFTPYRRCSRQACFCVAYLYGIKDLQGNFIFLNYLSVVPN